MRARVCRKKGRRARRCAVGSRVRLGTWAVAPQHPDGDEPHYLVITQSFSKITTSRSRTPSGGRLSRVRERTAQAGLSQAREDRPDLFDSRARAAAIVAPAFALFGYPGVLAALCLMGAAASALAWLIAWRVTGDQAASWFGWAAVALSVPFFFHASALFPDGLGAVLTLVSLLPLVDRRAREPRHLVAVGAALGVSG